MSNSLEATGSQASCSFFSNCSSVDTNDDTIEELENAIYDTNALSALDAPKRLLSQQKKGIFERTVCWCSALAFHLLLSKAKGLTLAGSKGSVDQSFKFWEEMGAVGDVLQRRISSAMLDYVHELFLGNEERFFMTKNNTTDEQVKERYVTSSPERPDSEEFALLSEKDEATLVADLKSLMGAEFREHFISLYSSSCWMSLVASLWGTSFSKLSEVERSMLDKAWASSQVTSECRENFIRIGSEAIMAVLTEHYEAITHSNNDNAEIPESLIADDSSFFPSHFSVEYTPSRSRIADSGQQWEVEEILARRFIGDDRRKNNSYEYLIKWKGFGEEYNSWEKFEDLDCRELIVQLKRKERMERNKNMRLLLEESILQNESENELASASQNISLSRAFPMRLDFSSEDYVDNSRSTF